MPDSPPDPRAPIHRAPVAVRAPYHVPDTDLDHLRLADTATWRRLRRLDREAALRDPIADLALTGYESHMLEHLAGSLDVDTTAVLVKLLWAARQARPLPVSDVHSGRA